MITIDNLTFTYPGASEPTLKSIALNVKQGEFLALAGNNGSGKSTLCKVINALIPQFTAGDIEGTATVCGMDTAKSDIGELAKVVGFVYQDFENQIICPTVLEDASFGCLNYAVAEPQERGRAALRAVGLELKENEYVWQLSGGEKHLLALAGVIALDPSIYVLDEPSAQLDFVHARRIYDILRDLHENHGKTIIVVEHHSEFIAEYCNQMILMDDGQIRWKRPAQEALRRAEELAEHNILPPQVTRAAQHLQKRGKLPSDCILPVTADEGRALFSSLSIYHCPKTSAGRAERVDPCVQFMDVEAKYSSIKKRNRTALSGMTLDLYRGQRTALAGRNGSGKSTLLKLLAGIIRPTHGDIVVNGQSVLGASVESIAKTVSLVFQNPEEMFVMSCVKDDITNALKSRGRHDWERRLDEVLSAFDLKDICNQDGRLLSGGQMRRASLAIGVAMKPAILLLDEPTSNLDMESRSNILHTLEQLENTVDTVIVATHDIQLISEWAERIIVLGDGTVLADGDRSTVFADGTLLDQAGLSLPIIYRIGKELDSSTDCFDVDDFVNLFEEGEAGV